MDVGKPRYANIANSSLQIVAAYVSFNTIRSQHPCNYMGFRYILRSIDNLHTSNHIIGLKAHHDEPPRLRRLYRVLFFHLSHLDFSLYGEYPCALFGLTLSPCKRY